MPSPYASRGRVRAGFLIFAQFWDEIGDFVVVRELCSAYSWRVVGVEVRIEFERIESGEGLKKIANNKYICNVSQHIIYSMSKPKLQPYIFPFHGILIDQNGLPTEVPFPFSCPVRVTPGVLAGKADSYKRLRPTFVLACSSLSIEVRSARTPEYIGRGMIRLHIEPDIENDTIVSTELVVIERPDRSFGSIDNAAYIWDDESFALIDIDEHPPSQYNHNRRFRAAFPDGNVSSIELQLTLSTIHLDRPRPLLMRSVLGRKGSYAPGIDENIHHIDAGLMHGRSSEYVITHSHRHGLEVFDKDLELVASFNSWKYPMLTPSNKVVSFDRYLEGVHVQSIDGHEINHLPDLKMFLHTDVDMGNWYRGQQPGQGFSLFDEHFCLRTTLPADCFRIALSPDGYTFNCGRKDPNRPVREEGKLFRCFSPDGDLVQSFCLKTREDYERISKHHTNATSNADDRRNLRFQPNTIVYTESLYAANTPDSTETMSYKRVRLQEGFRALDCSIIILPFENDDELCPVCGSSCNGCSTYSSDGDPGFDICPTCRFQAGNGDTPYDSDLDALFGGQFGRHRKQWLDRSGWLRADLDRIERVFQLDTDTWPRTKC